MHVVVRIIQLITFGLILNQSFALTLPLPYDGSDVVGYNQIIEVGRGQTFLTISKLYDVGYHELEEANPYLNPDAPCGEVLIPKQFVLPKVRTGIVVNLAELRLYYFPPHEHVVITYPVGIGQQGWSTPEVHTKIIAKEANPSWHIPPSILEEYAAAGQYVPEVIPPGPENPLGKFALRLANGSYLIHGTNRAFGVGLRVSHGCIRLWPKDIESLYSMVAVGTPVTIINEIYKVGRLRNKIYLEAHEPLSEDLAYKKYNLRPLETELLNLSYQRYSINWDRVNYIGSRYEGVPKEIGEVKNF